MLSLGGIATADGRLIPPHLRVDPRGRRISPVWLVLAALLAAALVLAAATYRPVASPASSPPSSPPPPPEVGPQNFTEGTRLSSGNLTLALPLMTAYEAQYNGTGFTTTTTVAFTSTPGESSNVTFEWERPAGAGMPVRFLEQRPSHRGVALTEGSFRFFPAGDCPDGLAAVQIGYTPAITGYGALLVGVDLTIPYEVWQVSLLPPFQPVSWLEVRYTLGDWVTRTYFLPVANVTPPAPNDLVPVGAPQVVASGSITGWSAVFYPQDFELPVNAFRFTGPALTLDAGRLGHLTTYLTSSFSWTNLTTYRIAMSGSPPPAGQTLAFQFYLDPRFGSLQARAIIS